MNRVILLVLALFLSTPALSGNILLERLFLDKEEGDSEKVANHYSDEDNCNLGCAEYDDGYSWAENHPPKNEDECAQGDYDSDRGCYDWLGDNR